MCGSGCGCLSLLHAHAVLPSLPAIPLFHPDGARVALLVSVGIRLWLGLFMYVPNMPPVSYPFFRDRCAASRVCLLPTLICSVDSVCACGGRAVLRFEVCAPPAVRPLSSGMHGCVAAWHLCDLPSTTLQHSQACLLSCAGQSQLSSCGCFSQGVPLIASLC